MSIESAMEEAEKVVKRQKTCESKVSDALDKLLDSYTKARDSIEQGGDAEQLLPELAASTSVTLNEFSSQVKDFHTAVGKLSKALDKLQEGHPDLCKAYRNIPVDRSSLSQIIAEHLYREGLFDVADKFAEEAKIAGLSELKEPYIAMHEILTQIHSGNLELALQWASEHREQLVLNQQHGSWPSDFEFKLHSLGFMSTLTTQGQQAAVAYAKANFQGFHGRFQKDIQRLMGCMLYYGKPMAESMYSDLLSPSSKDDVAKEFVKLCCRLRGQACESPLAVCVAAGAAALPDLLKLAAVMERNQQDIRTVQQLPIEIELGPEFVFHSIFACPVSRDQSSSENPPLLLPCNHVLCELSVIKIAKSRTRVFKCPYCPMEARADNLRSLIFPE